MARTLYQFFARTRIWFWWVCLFPALQIVNSGSGPPPGCSQQGGWFFVNSCGLSYLGEANSKVELWPSKRISRSWRHHLPTSLQSSRHGKRYIGDGNQSMCFFQASSKDVPRGRATLLDIQRYRQLPPRNHVNEHRCGGQLVRGHWPFILCSARDGRVTTGDKISLLEEKYWRALERSFLSSSYFCSCFLFFFVPFREAMSISAVPGLKSWTTCRCCPWREISSSWGLWDRAVAWEHGKLPWSVGTLAKPRSESWVTFRIFRCATLESWEVGICCWGVICNSEQLQQVGMMVAGCLGGFVVLLWLQPWWKNSQRVHFEGRNFKLPALLAGEFDKLETHLVTTCAHDKCEAGQGQVVVGLLWVLVDGTGHTSVEFHDETPGMTLPNWRQMQDP